MLRGALFGFKELAPGVGSAGGQGDAAFAALDEGWIVAVAVAMHGSSKTSGDDMVEALGATATLPDQGHVGSGSFAGPEVSLFGLAIAGAQVLNRCLPSLRSTPPGQPEAGCPAPFGSDRSVMSHSPGLVPVKHRIAPPALARWLPACALKPRPIRVGYFMPTGFANCVPGKPLRSNSTTTAARCSGGVRTRPQTSRFTRVDHSCISVRDQSLLTLQPPRSSGGVSGAGDDTVHTHLDGDGRAGSGKPPVP